jgi:acyl-CoA thioester hydrolase
MSKKLSNVTKIRVRYAETDKMGVVYNGNYLTYFEVGRTEAMRSIDLPYTLFENGGYQLPLMSAYVEYRNPAIYDDLLEIKAELDYSFGALIKFDYEIKCGDKLIATGHTKHTFWNEATKKPVRPPRVFMEKIKKALEE